ncbi:ubiquitin fusion degradation (UFD1) family protein, double Psi beta barrel fold [Cryptosporidium felis]|nr:ubiquitin fusion degradation (UFD1) family protein, double Psi beta barrel fold [Cryptosporidium felis]
MNEFESSLIRLKKQQENERKKFLCKKQRERLIRESAAKSSTFQADEYYSNIERKFLKQQQRAFANNDSQSCPAEEYSWILKLNLNQEKSTFPNNGETDKVILPNDLLKVLSSNESLYPLFFKVKCLNGGETCSEEAGSKKETHCGVLDYSEDSGFISLPNKILRCLNISRNTLGDSGSPETIWIQISHQSLPKGTSASFEIVNNDDIFTTHDIEALLQTYLRNYFNTLTIGDTIVVNQLYSSLSENCISIIEVKHLEPENSVSLINTDLVLDIHYHENPNLSGSNHSLESLPSSRLPLNPVTKAISLGDLTRLNTGLEQLKLQIPPPIKKLLDDDAARLVITLSGNEHLSGFDIFVSFPPIFEASRHLHIFRSYFHEGGNFSMEISNSDVTEYFGTITQSSSERSRVSFPSILFVTVEKPLDGNEGPQSGDAKETYVQVSMLKNYTSTEDSARTTSDDAGSAASKSASDPPLSECSNCARRVPASNMEIHSVQCERIYQKCGVCNLVLKRQDFKSHTHCVQCGNLGLSDSYIEVHNKLYHQNARCKLCGMEGIKPIQLKVHQTLECPNRVILCRFCNNFVQAGVDGHSADFKDSYYYKLTSHESYCGSRTTECTKCGKTVLIKDLQFHLRLAHHLDND